ncbi:ATP synthase F1 subunit delta [Ruminococcus sp. Marseille-P6503]|uniref:ATP synthase F1 subunit delta n=1 Tax=Ruminococcus sp. Marseille-P6503 TaxID=2364796 RepID=UPI000F5269DF|nr:ATP synthase F1 subunit delta [Ruminococcus sp. Marseille-P6503]
MAQSVENVYAGAMLELCKEQGSCDGAFEELEQCGRILSENGEFLSLLASPLIGAEEKKAALEKTFGNSVSPLTLDFFCVVTEKGRARYLPAICGEFKRLYFKENNILEVTVTTARPLSGELRDKLKAKLEKTLDKKIIMHENTDKRLLGGIIVRYDNYEIDSSVQGRLEKLKLRIDSVIA